MVNNVHHMAAHRQVLAGLRVHGTGAAQPVVEDNGHKFFLPGGEILVQLPVLHYSHLNALENLKDPGRGVTLGAVLGHRLGKA